MADIQKTQVAPEPQKTAAAPQKTAVAPQKTAAAPQKTAVAPQKTAAAPKVLQIPTIPQAGKPTKQKGEKVRLLGAGTEADVYVIDNDRVRKVYHPGFHANAKVYKALGQLRGKGVIADILIAGKDSGGNDYEEMPYFPLGSAADYDITGNEVAILALILRAAQSLDAIHKVGIVHKDIKPANILIHSTSTWECAITDFGIADLLKNGKVASNQARTPIYAAPELYDPKKAKVRLDGRDIFEITSAVDFYALGMTALSLWSGEETFNGQEEALAVQKVTKGIKVPKDMPPRLAKITRGLLESDPSKRWSLKQIEDSLGGKYNAVLALNPLADIKLCCDPSDPKYAMTGKAIGKFFNDLYLAYYQPGYRLPAEKYICDGILNSFEDYEGSMLQAFFQSKGNRFKDQERFMKYCFDWDSRDNMKKPWPHDEKERYQISFMKMIKGFGHEPYLTVPGTKKVIRTVAEYDALSYDDRKSLVGKGLDGWLACQFQENPKEDLSKKFRYEILTGKYLQKLSLADSGNTYVQRFRSARTEAESIYTEQCNKLKWAKRKNIIQTVLAVLLCLLLIGLTAVSAFGAVKSGSINVDEDIIKTICVAIIIISGIFGFFSEESLFTCVFIGVIVAVIMFFVIRFVGKYALWFLAAAHLAFLVFFFIKVKLFRCNIGPSLMEPGLEESLVEPLHYAYGKERRFDSSLNGQYSDRDMEDAKDDVKKRRKKIITFFIIALALGASDWFIPQIPLGRYYSNNMFPFKVEQVIEETTTEDEVQEVQQGKP